MVQLIKINDSYIHVKCDFDLALSLKDYFSFYTDNYRWNPKYKAGIWDGKISLFNIKNSTMPIGLLPRLMKYLKDANVEYEVDIDFKPINNNITPEFIQEFIKNDLKSDMVPRDYQLDAIMKIMRSNRCGIISPTGSGKSFNYFVAINLIRYFNPDWRILLIVPNISLVEQMHFDFLDYARNLDGYDDQLHKIYGGKSKHTDRPIVISTWQSLQELPKSYFAQFSAVFCDEFHLAQAQVMTKLIGDYCINGKYKVGMSGTLEDSSVKEIQLESMFGPITRVASTRDLIKKNVLTDIKITAMVLSYPEEERKAVSKMSYPDEMKFLREHKNRMKFLLKLITHNKKNILILFKNVEFGKQIHAYLQKMNTGRKVHLVYGNVDGEKREIIRATMEGDTDGITVASYQVFSTGINVKSLSHIVFAQPSKSKIKVLQSIGRALRKHDSKKKAVLLDIVDDLSTKKRKNYALKHAIERTQVYEKEGFTYKVMEIQI